MLVDLDGVWIDAKAMTIFRMQRYARLALAGSIGLETALRSKMAEEYRYGNSLPVLVKKTSRRVTTS